MADELEQRLNDPGFTPGIKLVPALLERAARGDATVRERASEALCRVQSAVGEAARRALVTMSAPERRRALAALAGRPRGLEDPALSELCAETLKDEDGALRIAAARVLGKLGGERAEAALVEALARATTEHERDALARALGKCGGGERAREALASLAGGGVSVQRARLMAERSTLRDLPRAPIELGEVPPGAPRVVVTCRRGLEPIVREELGARVARVRRIQEDARGGRLVADLDDGLSTLACVQDRPEGRLHVLDAPRAGRRRGRPDQRAAGLRSRRRRVDQRRARAREVSPGARGGRQAARRGLARRGGALAARAPDGQRPARERLRRQRVDRPRSAPRRCAPANARRALRLSSRRRPGGVAPDARGSAREGGGRPPRRRRVGPVRGQRPRAL
ncbi:MAG: HEAT repeat domain-containing protein [Polyangiaceae bacterium]|nr:HEAT repeat domain-containing protein [Polyangiaceae bacterium]